MKIDVPHRLVVALTLFAPIAWGTTYVTVTELLPDGRPLLVAAARVLPAGLVLAGVGWWRSHWRPTGLEWRTTVALAACNFILFFPLLIVAVYRLPGGVAAAAGGTQPLLVALLTWLSAGRRPGPIELVVGLGAALGVAMVVIRPDAGIDPVGVVAALGANVAFATGVVLTKRFPPPPDRVAAAGWQLLVAGAVLAPVALLFEGRPPTPTVGNLAGFAYLSLVGTALAFVLWFDGVRRLPVAAPPLLGLAAPLTGATLGWMLVGESLSVVQLAGFAVTIAAITSGTLVGATDRRLGRCPPPPTGPTQHDRMPLAGAATSA